jgi:hypothetical protein
MNAHFLVHLAASLFWINFFVFQSVSEAEGSSSRLASLRTASDKSFCVAKLKRDTQSGNRLKQTGDVWELARKLIEKISIREGAVRLLVLHCWQGIPWAFANSLTTIHLEQGLKTGKDSFQIQYDSRPSMA